jgi:hypothetical protein
MDAVAHQQRKAGWFFSALGSEVKATRPQSYFVALETPS